MLDPASITRLLNSGRYEEAESLCQSSILADPQDPNAWYFLAAVQSRAGRSADAVRSLKVAAACPADDEFHLRLAKALTRLRAFDAALPILERLDFSQPRVVLDLARCRWGVGQYELALKHMAGLWEALPGWPELAIVYAWALGYQDMPADAGRVLEAALERDPENQQLIVQYLCWLISQRGIRAAHEWRRGRAVAAPSIRLRLLTSALTELNEGSVPEAVSAEGLDLARWEGFRHLREQEGEIRWFGDATALLKQALESAPEAGIIVECGVAYGRSINLMAKWSGREIHGFDSFQGLPEEWRDHYPAGSFSVGGNMPQVADNVRLHPGWFDDTLPPFSAGLSQQIALLYVDCDLYSSTRVVLEHLGPHLAPGALVVFDEYTGYVNWRDHEHKAWLEFLQAGGRKAVVHSAELLGQIVAWRLE